MGIGLGRLLGRVGKNVWEGSGKIAGEECWRRA